MPKRFPRAFLSGSFTPEDRMVFDWFSGLLVALEFEVVNAARAEPQPPPDKIRKLIHDSDVLVALLARRQRTDDPDTWVAASWVHSEIGMAFDAKKPVAVFLEEGVRADGLAPWVADYVRFDRSTLAESAPSVVRYLFSVRNAISGAPALGEEIHLVRALAWELTTALVELDKVEETLECGWSYWSGVYAKITGRLFALPGPTQSLVMDAYGALQDVYEAVSQARGLRSPPWKLLGKENAAEKAEREANFATVMVQVRQVKAKAKASVLKATLDLYRLGFPELGEFVDALEDAAKLISHDSERPDGSNQSQVP